MQRCPECQSEQPLHGDNRRAQTCAECGADLDPKKRAKNPEEKTGATDQFASRSAQRPPVPPAEDAQNRKNM